MLQLKRMFFCWCIFVELTSCNPVCLTFPLYISVCVKIPILFHCYITQNEQNKRWYELRLWKYTKIEYFCNYVSPNCFFEFVNSSNPFHLTLSIKRFRIEDIVQSQFLPTNDNLVLIIDIDATQVETGSKFESDNSDTDQNHSSGYNSNGNPSHVSHEDLEDDQNEIDIVERINDQQVNFCS